MLVSLLGRVADKQDPDNQPLAFYFSSSKLFNGFKKRSQIGIFNNIFPLS